MPAPPLTKHPKLLCVDDDPGTRRFYERLLGSHGYEVVAAGSARQALRVVSSAAKEIDVVISDYDMPGMNGAELAEELKRSNPTLPVILMSGCQGVLEKVPRFIDAVLPKGAPVGTILERIDTLFASHRHVPFSRFVPLGSVLAGAAAAAYLVPKIWK